MFLMGGVGVVTSKKDIISIKTLHLTLAVVVGLLGASYTSQVRLITNFPSWAYASLTAIVQNGCKFLATMCTLQRRVQVLITRQNDCILAETYMRLDHLESAMHSVRHEELINGIMMRLDHLSTDINHIKDHAEDKVEETKKQAEFKQLVRNIIIFLNQRPVSC
jgi:hypothetical protein